MKTLLALTAAIALLTSGARAQTLTNTSDWSGIWGAITNSGLLNASNYAVEPYATYAPSLKQKWGGGVLVMYNVNQNVGLGLGGDYLGQFTLLSANLTVKAPIHPLNFMHNSFGTNFMVSPFALVGGGLPMSGTSGASGVLITDVGAYAEFGHLWGGTFNTGIAWGQWSNAGLYSGTRYHAFLGCRFGF